MPVAASTLLVGASGSGKTSWTRKAALKYDKSKVFVVNSPEFQDCTHLAIDEVVKRVSENSLLIFDDVISPPPKQVAVIKRSLLYTKRHKNVEVLVAVHSVLRNNVFELIPHFDKVVVTKAETNYNSFLDLCSRFLALPSGEAKQRWKDFQAHPDKFLYLEVNMRTKIFDVVTVEKRNEIGNSDDEEEEAKKVVVSREAHEYKRKRVYNVMSSLTANNPALGMSLFDLIFNNILSDVYLDELDLSMTLSHKGFASSKVSICDLLFFVTTPSVVPHPDTVRMFARLSKLFCIPDAFVRNKYFTKRKI